MKFIRVLSFDNQQEAHLVMGRLKNEGYECFLQNENFGTLMPHYANILGSGIDLMIKESDLPEIQMLLSDYLHPNNIVCPHCGSGDIVSGYGKNRKSKWFTVLLSLLAAVPFGNIKAQNCCEDCGEYF